MNLGFSAINALDESSALSAPATRILWPTDGSHWSASDHVFGAVNTVGMSEANPYHDYNYRTEFQIWKENKEFERRNILMSQPPLDSTPFGNNTTEAKITHLDLTPVGAKIPDLKPLT